MKLSELRTHEEVLAKQLKDPAFREEWERTAVARAVARRVLAYRAEKRLTQKQLARRLRVSQPWVARLEGGEHDPDLHTLGKLARVLRVEILVDVKPVQQRRKLVTKEAEHAPIVERFNSDGSYILIAAR